MNLNNLACRLSTVTVFYKVMQKKEMTALLRFLQSEDESLPRRLQLYSDFVAVLQKRSCSFSDFLQKAICEDENVYIKSMAKKQPVTAALQQNTEAELALFSELTALTPSILGADLQYDGFLPQFENAPLNLQEIYSERVQNIEKYGYGVFASSGMFRVDGDKILPVKTADTASLSDFVGYQQERQQVLDNTKALIEGRPAANVLLCGDAGTGKSSTVKAVANHFFDQGLRLIEIRKDQLFSLSYVMAKIAENPLKFIIFIDDLSFNKNDDCFSMLKAALEGSASAKAENAVIYATSNRRHIVKENFSDRGQEDDIHHSDTVQELLSLSDRFGLTVYFGRPPKALYLDIVHELAARNGIQTEQKELDLQAEAFALARGSRSPRAAEHFIKNLKNNA